MTKLLGVFILSMAAWGQPAAKMPELDAAPSEIRPHIERFTSDRGVLLRFYTMELSPGRLARLKKFYGEWLDRLNTVAFTPLSQAGKIDYIVFKNHLQHEIRQLDLDAKNQAEAQPFLPFTDTITSLEDARRRMDPVDPKKAASELDALTKQVNALHRKVQDGLRANPPNRTVAYRASGYVITLRSVLRHWFDFYNGYDPLFSWWAVTPHKEADAALQTYATFLREQVAGVKGGAPREGGRRGQRDAGAPSEPPPPPANQRPSTRSDTTEDIAGDPIGREGLMSELAAEMIPYTPEDLIAIANKEYVWCLDQMKKASNDLGFGDDWKRALEHVKTLYVDPGKQPQLIRDLAREAEEFLDKHDLVTVPPLARETWRMEMMTPERQLVNPFFTGGEVISVSYPVEAMTYEQKLMTMRGNNVHFSRATVFHELIPGHELQLFQAARYRPYRGIFGTPFLVEGWSLYWEMLLWDMKFQKSPEDRVGALFWRMHRCARIIFSLSFHLGKMTPQQCVDLLVDKVGHERDNAIGEVRRSFAGSYSPLYQAAYLLGGLQLYKLHQEVVGAGKMSNRQFHDAVLMENRIPVEMIRASLTKQALTKDFVSSWKFYGVAP